MIVGYQAVHTRIASSSEHAMHPYVQHGFQYQGWEHCYGRFSRFFESCLGCQGAYTDDWSVTEISALTFCIG